MEPESVVLPTPTVGQELKLRCRGEQLGIEALNPKPALVDAGQILL